MKIKQNQILYSGLFSGLGIFSFLLLVNHSGFPPKIAHELSTIGTCLFFILAFNVLGYSTIRISSWLNNQYALNIKNRGKSIAIYLLVTLAFLLLNYSLLVTAKLLVGSEHLFTFPNGGLRILILVWLIELVVLGLLLAYRSTQNALQYQQHVTALQKENNTARYTALQNQLNPHFLFNSLNTLIAEIEYDPRNAIHFTKNLSNVYRYVLQCQDKPLVTLAEELEFMQAYLFLHEVRLGNCIICDCNIPSGDTDRSLPPLTLQLLVENVIKHNTISATTPMRIEIRTDQDFLVVSNLIHPKKSTVSGGVGLKNLSNRCLLILGQEIDISEKQGVFTVRVPLGEEN